MTTTMTLSCRHALPELTNAMLTLSAHQAHPSKTSADLDALIEGHLSTDKDQLREKAERFLPSKECEQVLRRCDDTILDGNERVTSSFADELTKVRVTAENILSLSLCSCHIFTACGQRDRSTCGIRLVRKSPSAIVHHARCCGKDTDR